ncbi:hypothetical protein SAMN04489761_2775 [Tenacibaculum sp. MAR_2009_124]|uniref:DUF6168 family protein n=1 Tax=Tenacibaculum sp. MAR_2009_124 TaxID=1250059 RepID=UPI00089B7F39|nr:DUF6168 family protein [Tenacibaculum sp. MAR_2009_124]SEC36026.1 hypothetical protein SAMN04489761_2775 [Tenacibaculum sp. MAR_2009_124]
MIKRIIIFLVVVLIAYIASYLPHFYILQIKQLTLGYSLFSVYGFFVIAAILIYGIVEFIADKMPNQAGYAYLASMFLKIGFFLLIFQNAIFKEAVLTKAEKFSLIIPLFLFLALEAVFISKLLNNK